MISPPLVHHPAAPVLRVAGQPHGRGGGAGAAGGLGDHPGLRRVPGGEPGREAASHGVCPDGKSVVNF